MADIEKNEIATLAGGCFWCLEAVFDQLRGVGGVVSGYMGGTLANPSYETVCNGATGHAEVVQISFDPQAITFEQLLVVFFAIHDPTTLNRQGNDSGSQYRSAIFFHTPQQQAIAQAMIARLAAEDLWDDTIATEIVPAQIFYPAEDYHQEYFRLNGHQPYCQMVVAPKLAQFRSRFAAQLKR